MSDRDYSSLVGAEASVVTDFRLCGCPACRGNTYDSEVYVSLAETLADHAGNFDSLGTGPISAAAELSTHANTTIPGSLSGAETYDLIAVDLVAGQTYTFSYRGTETDGVQDPYLGLFGPGFAYITEDDDGGFGRTSQITYTAASTGTYYLYATSWYHIDPGAPGYPDFRDSGDYTINVWSPDPAHDAPGTFAGAVTIDVGTTFAYLDSAADLDMYKIEAVEGMVYTLNYSGGISGAADWDDEPGENIGRLRLYDANGNQIATNLNYESALSFFAEEGGTYYVRVESYAGTSGGYTLDVGQLNPLDYDPLEAFIWDRAANIDPGDDGVVKVYFAVAGESFGELADNGTDPLPSFGWNAFEKQQVMQALGEYTKILGFTYEVTTDASEADFRLITTESTQYGAYFYPQDPVYGDAAGIGAFNVLSGGWTFDQQQSLAQGGFAFAVVLHEFGHAHGLSHPHDTGGGSQVMLGVAGSASYGIYDLNQGVYTVMSYNDAWDTGPNGPTPYTGANIDSGWSGTLSAFDIAALQARYGIINEYATGDDVYELGDANDPGVYYETIWDTGGTDEIRYSGTRDARIDLLAATIDYTPTGGGVVSYVDGIWGGYTIARGVVIENASGGDGDDVIIGNSAANVLKGNGGDDWLMGREGADKLDGGDGFDTASYKDAKSGVAASLASKSGTLGDAAGDKYVSIEKLEGSQFGDTLAGGSTNDVLSGLGGDDTLTGGNGADTLDGGDGDDTLEGGNGNDVLLGGAGADTLSGGNDHDTLEGGAGNDVLSGGNGNDVLNGGAGDDVLVGGSGYDMFAFTEIGGDDKINDFRRGQDKIDLSGIDAVAGGGDDAFSWVGSAAFTNTAGELRVYSQGGKHFLAGDVDGDGLADFTIQTNTLIVQADLVL